MRKIWVLALVAMLLGGCNAGPSAEQVSAVRNQDSALIEMAKAKKISWAEAVRRSNANAAATVPGASAPDAQAALAYRLMLASEIDSGKITFEQFDFLWKKYVADISARDAQQRQVAVANASNGLIAAGAAISAAGRVNVPPSFSCSSYRLGRTIQTDC